MDPSFRPHFPISSTTPMLMIPVERWTELQGLGVKNFEL